MKSRWRKLRQRAALALAPELAADRKAADVAAVADRLASEILNKLEDRLPARITLAIPEPDLSPNPPWRSDAPVAQEHSQSSQDISVDPASHSGQPLP